MNSRIVSDRFDADTRGWRLFSSFTQELSSWLEMITPLFPSCFLALATISNIGKSISFLANGATGAGIRYGFANAMNIGDVTAKEGSQTSAVYLLGMLFGVSVSSLIGDQSMSTLFASVICMSCFSLYAMNKSLRCVTLPTLNTQVVSTLENHP